MKLCTAYNKITKLNNDDAGDDRPHLMVYLGMFFPVGPHLPEGLAIKFSLSHLIYSLSPSLLRFSVLTVNFNENNCSVTIVTITG